VRPITVMRTDMDAPISTRTYSALPADEVGSTRRRGCHGGLASYLRIDPPMLSYPASAVKNLSYSNRRSDLPASEHSSGHFPRTPGSNLGKLSWARTVDLTHSALAREKASRSQL
jgi:hypothetical protein